MRGVHSIVASAGAMLKRDQDIFLVPEQFEQCQNHTNTVVVTLMNSQWSVLTSNNKAAQEVKGLIQSL